METRVPHAARKDGPPCPAHRSSLWASAGGIEALRQVASGLPPNLPAAVFVVLHTPAHGIRALPMILDPQWASPGELRCAWWPDRAGSDRRRTAESSLADPLRPRRVDARSQRERLRPAADAALRSAARAHGRRVIGVVLSGTLDDGTAGLLTVRQHGVHDRAVRGPRRALDQAPLRACERSPAVLPQGSPPADHLRSSRPRPRCADLAHRPADLREYADVSSS